MLSSIRREVPADCAWISSELFLMLRWFFQAKKWARFWLIVLWRELLGVWKVLNYSLKNGVDKLGGSLLFHFAPVF
jgi:hypothetical protein